MQQAKRRTVFRLSEEINPTFRDVWYTDKPYVVLEGGRNSFKSSVISLWIAIKLLSYIKDGKKANFVIIRKVANTIRESVFLKMQWALEKLGILDKFKVQIAPFRIMHKQSGSTIYFYGQDDFAKLKSNDILNIVAVWYEEAAEFASAEEFDQSTATFARQKHPEEEYVRFFWSYNPPRNPYNWINEWTEDKAGEENYLVHRSSYKDDRLGFVTSQMLEEIDRIKRNDFDYYRYLYLGEPVGLGTNVYNFELFQKVNKLPDGEFIRTISYGLDTGHQQSATSCLCIGFTNKENIIILDNYYYDPSDKHRKLAPDELSDEIHAFVEKTQRRYQKPIYKRTIDSAEGAIRNQYYKDHNIRWRPINKGKKVDMIDNVIILLAQGRVYYLDTPNNDIFAEEQKNYRWKENTINSDNPKVIEVDDHSADALQYFVNDNLEELGLIW